MKKGEHCLYDPRKLYPTQFCLGYKEIVHKQDKILKMDKKEYEKYLMEKITPAVIGPEGKIYIIDHHHHARSLINLNKPEIILDILEDYSSLPVTEFIEIMTKNKYLNLYDEQGKIKNFSELPTNLIEMKHDYFRSLAWAVREKNGFKKVDEIPFFEFRWGEFFRSYITEKLIEDQFKSALEVALVLAKSKEAKHLPGYLG